MRLAGHFDWDDGNREKCQKHGVSIVEIETVLLGDPLVAPDLAHSDAEDRLIAVGKTPQGRAVFIAFTLRTKNGKLHLRPVSARYMHAKEARRYD
mgnify:CR=1 FL=1